MMPSDTDCGIIYGVVPVRLAASRLALTQETEVRILDRELDPGYDNW